MKTFSKTLNLEDYEDLGNYCLHIDNIMNHFDSINKSIYRLDHTHRRWEYGMIYKALDENKTVDVLDVGGGGGVLDPALAWVGMNVDIIDTEDLTFQISEQNRMIQKSMNFERVDLLDFESKKKYDAVIADSVIEHVENDTQFFTKLLSFVKPEGIVAITTDFHPSGLQIVPFHLRTYNKKSLMKLANLAKTKGFNFFNGEPEYNYFAENVNGCTFASLIMKKE